VQAVRGGSVEGRRCIRAARLHRGGSHPFRDRDDVDGLDCRRRSLDGGVSIDIPLVPAAVKEPVQQARAGWGDADAHVVL
jgi:hypothetical protein